MNTQRVNEERVRQILASYGSNSFAWPEQERDKALELIKQSSQLKMEWLQAQRLDQAMETEQTAQANEHLFEKILNNLPEQDRGPEPQKMGITPISNKKTRKFSSSLRGMMAASLALFLTSIIIFSVNYVPSSEKNAEIVAQTELEQWFWEEITVDAGQQSEDAMDFMALIDLEQLEDFQ